MVSNLKESNRATEAPRDLPYALVFRVYTTDLGLNGVTDAASCVRFMDRGRVETIEALCSKADRASWLTRFMVNVYRFDAVFAAPARIGDLLEVRSGLHPRSSHRAAFDHRVVSTATGDVVGDATVEVLFIDAEGELAPVPVELVAKPDTEQRPLVPATLKFTPRRREVPFPFHRRYRVYYEDTDTQGIAYHVTYLRFTEQLLVDLLSETCGAPSLSAWFERHRITVTRLTSRYLRSARLGDVLDVQAWVRDVGDHHALVECRLMLHQDTKEIITATTFIEVTFSDVQGAPELIPRALRSMKTY